jgi:broad specificity phosphatase PhoE
MVALQLVGMLTLIRRSTSKVAVNHWQWRQSCRRLVRCLRCQQTAFPLATAWKQNVTIEPMVGEIPSPEGYSLETRSEWLRAAMATTWSAVAQESGAHYAEYHTNIAKTVAALTTDTVIFSHFIAINAVIGAATNDDRVLIHHLENCSVSVFDTDGAGGLKLIEVGGEDVNTLVR